MADLNTNLTRFLYGLLPQFGGSVSGTLTTSTTSAATIADTNETTLWTYSLPANTLDADGRALRIIARGTTGATANNKTVKLYFGATTVSFGPLALNNKPWVIDAIVFRTGAATQLITGSTTDANGYVLNFQPATPAETLSGAITVKVTGTNGTAAANDIVFKSVLVEAVGRP